MVDGPVMVPSMYALTSAGSEIGLVDLDGVLANLWGCVFCCGFLLH